MVLIRVSKTDMTNPLMINPKTRGLLNSPTTTSILNRLWIPGFLWFIYWGCSGIRTRKGREGSPRYLHFKGVEVTRRAPRDGIANFNKCHMRRKDFENYG